jgi:hypothetical protein
LESSSPAKDRDNEILHGKAESTGEMTPKRGVRGEGSHFGNNRDMVLGSNSDILGSQGPSPKETSRLGNPGPMGQIIKPKEGTGQQGHQQGRAVPLGDNKPNPAFTQTGGSLGESGPLERSQSLETPPGFAGKHNTGVPGVSNVTKLPGATISGKFQRGDATSGITERDWHSVDIKDNTYSRIGSDDDRSKIVGNTATTNSTTKHPRNTHGSSGTTTGSDMPGSWVEEDYAGVESDTNPTSSGTGRNTDSTSYHIGQEMPETRVPRTSTAISSRTHLRDTNNGDSEVQGTPTDRHKSDAMALDTAGAAAIGTHHQLQNDANHWSTGHTGIHPTTSYHPSTTGLAVLDSTQRVSCCLSL